MDEIGAKNDANCNLEHQFGALAPAVSAEIAGGSKTRYPVPARTKCPDAAFPEADFVAAGYPHCVYRGEKGYNGVAMLSRLPLYQPHHLLWAGKEDCRTSPPPWIAVSPSIISTSPPVGDIPDATTNPKFAHKLQFLDELATWSKTHAATQKAVLVGDLNIAPREDDVWSHKQLLKVVSHTPIEVNALNRVMAAGQWHDAVRANIPDGKTILMVVIPRPRLERRRPRDGGLTISGQPRHYVSGQCQQKLCARCGGWERPSDHAPVLVEFGF